MGRFINPFTDWGFKRLFGQEITKDLLINFLNDLLKDERVITDITFLSNEQTSDYPEDRVAIYDIYCETETGEKIIVEMQNKAQPFFKDRALYYLSRAITKQAKRGQNWGFDIKAVYGVFFLNFDLFDNEKFRIDVIMADRETGELFSDKMRQIFITLPLFKKEEDECKSDFDCWMYVLKHMDMIDRMPFKARNQIFERLEKMAELRTLSQDERDRYENSIDTLNSYYATIDYAKQEGLQEGLEKGIEKGIEKGVEQTALKMKNAGMDADSIAGFTGLSIDAINKL